MAVLEILPVGTLYVDASGNTLEDCYLIAMGGHVDIVGCDYDDDNITTYRIFWKHRTFPLSSNPDLVANELRAAKRFIAKRREQDAQKQGGA